MKQSRIAFLVLILCSGTPAFGAPGEPSADDAGKRREELDFMHRGEDHFFAHRFGAALQWFRRVLEINPDNALAHAYSGDILLSLNEPDEALRHYVIAAELEAEPSAELFRIGQIYYLKGETTRAETQFLRALSANENLSEAHFYLGLIAYRKKKNRAETLKHLKTFRERRPGFAGRERLDRAIALLEDPATPLDESKDLIDVDPLRLFYRRGPEQKAEPVESTSPVKSDASQPGENTDRTENAEASPGAADTGSPQKPEPQPEEDRRPTRPERADRFLPLDTAPTGSLQKAQAYREDEPAKALAILDKARRASPSDARIPSLQCEILVAEKRPKEAVPACQDAARLSPDYRNLYNLGFVLESIGDGPGAFRAYRQALDARLNPDLATRAARLGASLQDRGPEVRSIVERLLARRPDHRDGLLLLLALQTKESDPVGLRGTVERIIALYPEDRAVLRDVVGALLARPLTEKEALPILEQYVRLAPDDVPAGLTLARLHMKYTTEEQALAVLQSLYAGHPEDADVVREILVLFVHNNRNLDSAETVARSFLEKQTDPALRSRILEVLPEEMRTRLVPPSPLPSSPEEKKSEIPNPPGP